MQPFTGSYSAGAFPCKQQIPDKSVRLRFYSSPSLRGGRFENRMRGFHRREEQLAARASAHLDQNTAHLLWPGLTGPHEVDRVASRRWPKPSRVNPGQPARPRTQVSLQRTMSSTPWPGAEQAPKIHHRTPNMAWDVTQQRHWQFDVASSRIHELHQPAKGGVPRRSVRGDGFGLERFTHDLARLLE